MIKLKNEYGFFIKEFIYLFFVYENVEFVLKIVLYSLT